MAADEYPVPPERADGNKPTQTRFVRTPSVFSIQQLLTENCVI
jgi:hypothetical protein